MKKLTDDTMHDFVAAPGAAIVLVCASHAGLTMLQAEEFALLWAETPDLARFGFLDAHMNEQIRADYAIRYLPTLLVFWDGALTAKLEGFRTRGRIRAALIPPAPALLAA